MVDTIIFIERSKVSNFVLNSIGYTVQDENQGVKKLTLGNSCSSETKFYTERYSRREKRNEL